MQVITQQIPDSEVVARVMNGEKELYELLMRRHNQLLYRVVRGYLNDEENIEDAMQETYLHAYEKLHQFRGDATFSTWLVRIGMNEALKHIRGAKRRQVVHPDGELHEELISRIADTMDPEKKTIQYETKHLIDKAIDHLPEKYRIVFVMREVQEMNGEEVAACLNISVENVKVRLHRAKS